MAISLPHTLAAGTPENVNHVQENDEALRDGINAVLAVVPTLVTSLPGSPADGQEVFYVADATNGVTWHLRYRSASASTYKWEFVGGSELIAEVSASETTTSGAYTNLATVGPEIIAPLAGDYLLGISGLLTPANFAGSQAFMSVQIGGAAAQDVDSISSTTPAAAAMADSAARRIRRNVPTAGLSVIARYKFAGVSPALFARRVISLVPVRVI